MSENPVSQEKGAQTLDYSGVTVLGLPTAPAITSINGDTTPAQHIQITPPGLLVNVGSVHTISYPPFLGVVPGPSAQGLVPDPIGSGPTDYLAADATFKPIPAPVIPADIPIIQKLSWTNAQIVALGHITGPAEITLITLPPRTAVANAWIVITGQAAGTGVCTATVGYNSPFTDYLKSFNLQGPPNSFGGNVFASRGTRLDPTTAPKVYNDIPSLTGSTAIKMSFTVDTFLDQVTGSSGDVFLQTYVLP
jgi:hypothetical protein